jgi:ABC-2 type transport system permease protein
VTDLAVPGARVEDDGFVAITTAEPTKLLHELTAWALAHGGELAGLEVHRPLTRRRLPGPHPVSNGSVKDIALLGNQIVLEQKRFWRNPTSAIFSAVFPIMLLVIFASLNSNDRIKELGNIRFAQYYVPAILAFGLFSACFVNLAIATTFRREEGLLKRVRATPLPPQVFIGGLILSTVLVGALLSVVVTATGVVFYGVHFYTARLVALLVTFAVAASSCCALGLALGTFLPNADAAPAVVNFVYFPIVFISGTFFPVSQSSFLAHVAGIFPVRHVILAVYAGFDPLRSGAAFRWGDLALIAGWGVAGLIVAVRRFRWEPSH